MSTTLCYAGPGCLGCSFCDSADEFEIAASEDKREKFYTLGDIVKDPRKNQFHPEHQKKNS